jgi:hypothetical protein
MTPLSNIAVSRMLPYTETKEMRIKTWSILYSYNLHTVRDVFLYCARKGRLEEKQIYQAMNENLIAPPKERWSQPDRKKQDRLGLEYIHACLYLGFLRRDGDFIMPNLTDFSEEKKSIFCVNRNRKFLKPEDSTLFTEIESKAMLSIIWNYERARDFLRWFLDFKKYPTIASFSFQDFIRDAKPVFLNKTNSSQRGSTYLKRSFEKNLWKIPKTYSRLATNLFPNWFIDLKLIDEIIVFPEFSFDRNLWHMYYPIKINDSDFLKQDFSIKLKEMFASLGTNRITTPHLLYYIATNYGCTVNAIKQAMNNLYSKSSEEFYLERMPEHLMKRVYKISYIEVDGFFRSNLCYEGTT